MGSAQVALSMWLGMMLDGIPEALMLGFMTNEGSVTFSFLVAIFIANFPEAFSGSSLLRGQKMPVSRWCDVGHGLHRHAPGSLQRCWG